MTAGLQPELNRGGRDFSSANHQYIVNFLRNRAPDGTLQRVFARAGERRSVEELIDAATWSSYAEFRSLLVACGQELGYGVLAQFGLDSFAEISTPDTTAMLIAFGSPAALYADIGPAADGVSPAVALSGESVGPTEWLMRMHFRNGLEAFPEYCLYAYGLLSVTPRLFGYQPATVIEERCQCRGDSHCVFRVSWRASEEPDRELNELALRVQVLTSSLDALQSTVAHLVSGADVDEALERIVTSAARAVQAPAFVLAIDRHVSTQRHVYTDGLLPTEAERIATAMAAGSLHTDAHTLVVELASTLSHYGWLAAVNPEGQFYPQQLATLQTYARLAAAALDAAAAHEETRNQATRAQALLELSIALAEVATTDDMAQRIAQAVPRVIDCDRALVVLTDSPTHGRVVGIAGYPPATAAALAGFRFPLTIDADSGVRIELSSSDAVDPGPGGQHAMAWTGTVAAATLPIVSNGDVLGYITASVTDDPERLTQSADLETRLRGIEGHARTALQNAALLDEVRHQALHDSLTGLPNRSMILDSATRMLSRSRRFDLPVAALFVDLDDFKAVNDRYGHRAGDALLRVVADRLSRTVRADDIVGRLGGDEFIVLTDGALNAGPESIAARIIDALNAPVEIDGYDGIRFTATASIGIATGLRDSASQLLHDADIALYQAKSSGRGRVVVFDSDSLAEPSQLRASSSDFGTRDDHLRAATGQPRS